MNKMKITLTSLAMLLVAVCVNAQTFDDVAGTFNEAAEKYNAKDYAAAIPLFEKVITDGEAIDPEADELVAQSKMLLPQACFLYGGSQIQGGNAEAAAGTFAKALELAEAYDNMQVASRARQWVGKAYTAWGGTAFNAKNYSEAIEIFSKGYAMSPNDVELANNLALSYAEMDNFDQAFEIYRKVIDSDPGKNEKFITVAKDRMSFYLLKQANDIQGADRAKAIELLEESVQYDPSNQTAYLLMVQTANNARNYDKVIAVGDAAAAAQSEAANKSTVHFLMGAAYENKGNDAKAVENYRKVTAGPHVATAKAQIAAING